MYTLIETRARLAVSAEKGLLTPCSCHGLIDLPLLEKHGRNHALHCRCFGCCLGFVSFPMNDFSTSLYQSLASSPFQFLLIPAISHADCIALSCGAP
jgi:hypothetical protein